MYSVGEVAYFHWPSLLTQKSPLLVCCSRLCQQASFYHCLSVTCLVNKVISVNTCIANQIHQDATPIGKDYVNLNSGYAQISQRLSGYLNTSNSIEAVL